MEHWWNKTTFPQELTILKSNYLKMIYELGVAAFIIFYTCTLKDQLFETSNDNGCPSPTILNDRLQLKHVHHRLAPST
jgi:hypothetical protein